MGAAVKLLRRQTSHAATPIATYRIVQTGANNQFGGVQLGLDNPLYQVIKAGRVSKEPNHPAPRHTTTQRVSLIGLSSESKYSRFDSASLHSRACSQAVSQPYTALFSESRNGASRGASSADHTEKPAKNRHSNQRIHWRFHLRASLRLSPFSASKSPSAFHMTVPDRSIRKA